MSDEGTTGDNASSDAAKTPPADSAKAGAGLSGFATAVKDSRDAAKWLLAGFGAIAAVLVAGTQVSGLGTLTDPVRLIAAVIALAIGLTAISLAAALTMWLLLPGFTTLSEISSQELQARPKLDLGYVGDVLKGNPEIGEGYAGAVSGDDGLLAKYRNALGARAAAYDEYLAAYGRGDDAETAVKERAFRRADSIASELGRVAGNITTVASYRRVNRDGRHWTVGITALALITGVSIAAFAWAANPPKDDEDEPAAISMRGIVLTNVDLSGRDLSGIDFTGATFDRVNLRGTTIEADNLANTVWKDSTCPNGTVVTEPENCLAHLK